MKTTFLDEPTYLPEQSVRRLERLGELTVYRDRPNREQAIERLSHTDVAVLEWTAVDRSMFDEIDRLKYIVVSLTGYSFVDVEAAREHGIRVSNVPNYSTESVAEYAVGLLIAVNRRIVESSEAARSGKRNLFEPFLGVDLQGRTLGVVGFGNIGSRVAQIAVNGLGMRVVVNTRTRRSSIPYDLLDLEDLVATSDAIVISVNKTPLTKGLFDRDLIATMKDGAFLVSVVSEICDEKALAEALISGKLRGAALDLPSKDSPLKDAPNCVISTGVGWYTEESLERLARKVVDNIEGFLANDLRNAVN